MSHSSQGLDCQKALSELNLAHNKISSIGTSLDHLTALIELNMSGNLLSSLSDLVHLSNLPHLTTLALCDPLYPPNPVAALCNYSTHVLYHLPNLHWLDGVNVASEELRMLVEGVVERKKRFYRMKTHHIRATAHAKRRDIRERINAGKRDIYSNIREITRQLKTVSIYCYTVAPSVLLISILVSTLHVTTLRLIVNLSRLTRLLVTRVSLVTRLLVTRPSLVKYLC